MADASFNLNNQYTLYGEGTDARLSISAFKGKTYIKIFQAKSRQISFLFDKDLRYHVIKTLETVKKAGPDTRIPIVISKFNIQIKQREVMVNIVIGKNEKQVIYIEISAPGSQNFVFGFKSSKNIDVGSTPMGDAESSQVAVDVFLQYVRMHLPMAEYLSSYGTEDEQNGFRSRNTGPTNNTGRTEYKPQNYQNREPPKDRTFEESPVPLAGDDDDTY